MQSPMQPDSITAVKRQFASTNGAFSHHNAIFQEVSNRMLARLDLLAITPARILDLGCRDGYQLGALQARFPNASIVAADIAGSEVGASKRWWKRKRAENDIIAVDPHDIPFEDGSFDLVLSNLLLPWCHDPALVFKEVVRVLSDDGAFMFTSAGPDTLQELDELWRQIDTAQHTFGLVDMHQVGDQLLAAGIAAPVLDRENIVVDYPSVDALQDELRLVGAANIAIGRRNGLMAPAVRKMLSERAPEGRFSVTLELVQGHGWKGSLASQEKNDSGEFTVSLDSLRQSLRGSGQ